MTLWEAVIVQAIDDLLAVYQGRYNRDTADSASFFSDGRLETYCKLAGLNPDVVREAVLNRLRVA